MHSTISVASRSVRRVNGPGRRLEGLEIPAFLQKRV